MGRVLPYVLVVGVLLFLVARSLFTVRESQLALRTEFGALAGGGYAPGLHLKWPVDEVVKLDRRLQSQSYTGETFITNDERSLIVDFYVTWRVGDPAAYFRATGAQEDVAAARLAEIVRDGIKGIVAQRSLTQLVSAERAVTAAMLEQARARARLLGVTLADVRVERIDLPEEVAARVYESMKATFANRAAALRAEGQSRADGIRAAADRERMEVLSTAQGDALKVRGESDAEAARIYARAYSRNPEFYAFYRSLQAYRNVLGKEGDLLVITPDGDFFKYLKSPDGHAPAPPPPPAPR